MGEARDKFNTFIVSIFASIYFQFVSPTLDIPLRTEVNAKIDNHWHLPLDFTYHYYNSPRDIPQLILPVSVDSLPSGDGVWLLAHEDFVGQEEILVVEEEGNIQFFEKAIITFISKSLGFRSLTVKALAFGEVDLQLVFKPDDNTRGGDEVVVLFENNEWNNCTGEVENKDERNLKWIVFEVHANRTHKKISLEGHISHFQSFYMIDEIVIHLESCDDPPVLEALESYKMECSLSD